MIVWSSELLASHRPSGEGTTETTGLLCPAKNLVRCPVSRSKKTTPDLAADSHGRPGMARAGGDHGGRPPVPLGVAIELEPPPAAVLVHRLEDEGLDVALQGPPVQARDGAAELVAGHPPPLLPGEVEAEVLRRVGGIGGRPKEADRLAVGREPQVERRAPPALQLEARPIRIADVLDRGPTGHGRRRRPGGCPMG